MSHPVMIFCKLLARQCSESLRVENHKAEVPEGADCGQQHAGVNEQFHGVLLQPFAGQDKTDQGRKRSHSNEHHHQFHCSSPKAGEVVTSYLYRGPRQMGVKCGPVRIKISSRAGQTAHRCAECAEASGGGAAFFGLDIGAIIRIPSLVTTGHPLTRVGHFDSHIDRVQILTSAIWIATLT